MIKLLRKTVAALAVVLVTVSGCGQSEQGRGAGFRNQEQRIPSVEAVEVRHGTLPLEERLAGSVRARNQTDIYAQVSGPIVEVFVNDGDRVEAGDPLVRIRSTDYEERVNQAASGLQVAEARVKQAEANLTRLQAALRRMEAMAERNLGSAADLEAAQADFASAQADLALMQAQRAQAASLLNERRSELSETVVRAPVTGIVGGRNAEVGQLATTNDPLFVVGDTTQMRVRITLTQGMLAYIRAGTTVNIFNDAAPEESIRSSIARISPFLHPITRTTDAEIEVEEHDGALRPGMFVTVDVLHGESEVAALVPNSALYRHPRDGREGVYATSLADAGRNPESSEAPSLPGLRVGLEPTGPVAVHFVPVEVTARGRLSSAISGVQPGEWVVTLGHHLLSSSDTGQAVIQPTPWEHIMSLQQMQTRDLLDIIETRQNALRNTESLN